MTTKNAGKVLELYISQKGIAHRLDKSSIDLDQNGVVEDKFYNTDINRSVLITSIQSYELAQHNKINMQYGALGENLLIDYNPYGLAIGTQLQIGEVILELSQACTLCNHLSKIDKRIPRLLKDDRGVFAKVIKQGTIKTDDKVVLLTSSVRKD
ncbi:MAG: MOSC domain-containing protein [Campylobacterota bacterium]|nr:MOSC domain-containing protein [Campylobacterota bacterium]